MPTASASVRRRVRELETLTGLTAIEAIARLRALELRPAVEPCDAGLDDRGLVLAQEPEAGVEMTRGQLVTLIVGEQQGSSAQSPTATCGPPRDTASLLEPADPSRLTRRIECMQPGTEPEGGEIPTLRLAEPARVTALNPRPAVRDEPFARPEPRWQSTRKGRARHRASSERLVEPDVRPEHSARRRRRLAVAWVLASAILLAIPAGMLFERPGHRSASVQARRRVVPAQVSSRDHILPRPPGHVRSSRRRNTVPPARSVKPPTRGTTSGVQGAGRVRSTAPPRPTLDARAASAPADTQAVQTAARAEPDPVSPIGPLPGPPPTN